ncbi:MAG: hypothetical protein K2F99_09165, partial [Muribaculaceae bacterium]|nr:hypothetical protein [Muribaculaceae bacterium]
SSQSTLEDGRTLVEAIDEVAAFRPNLIKGANKVLDSTSYGLGDYKWDARPEVGTKCSITVCGKVGATDESIGVYQNGGYNTIGHFYSKTETVQTFEFEVIDNPNTPSTSIAFYHAPNDGNYDSGSYIKWAVVTVGSGAASAWVPSASEMTAQNLMSRYSADASAWHPNYQSGDVWMQTSNDGGKTWSAAVRITGSSYAPNLLKDTQSRQKTVGNDSSVPANFYTNLIYEFDTPLAVKIGDKLTLSVENIEILAGTPTEFSVYLYDTTSGAYGDIVTISKAKPYVTLKVTKDFTAKHLLIYIGKAGSTLGNSVRYNKVMLVKGDTPTPWSPAASEMVGKDGSYPIFQWTLGTINAPTGTWNDTPQTAQPGQYVWMRSGVVVPPATTPATWGTAVRLTGDSGYSYTLDLSDEMMPMACDSAGNVVSSYKTSQGSVFKGATKVTSGITYSIAQATGVSATISPSGLVTPSALTADTATIVVQAVVDGVTLQTTLSLYKVKPGVNGTNYAPNLLIDTKTGFTNWQSDNPTASTITTAIDSEGFRVMTQTLTEANANHNAYIMIQNFCDYGVANTLVKGRTYTLSFDYKSDDEIQAQLGRYTTVWGYYNYAKYLPASAEWKRGFFTFVCDVDGAAITKPHIQIHIKHGIGAKGDKASFRKFCLVEGESTEWTPAASEMLGKQGYGTVASVSRPSFTEAQWNTYGTIGHVENWSGTENTRNGCRIGDYFAVYGTATDTGKSHVLIYKSDTDSGTLHGVCERHEVADAGADAVVYSLELSANNISRDALGNLSASSITVQKYKTTGASARTLTTEKTVRYQRIGVDSATTTCSAGTSSYNIPVPDSKALTAIIVELMDGTTVLDRERIPVITNGTEVTENLIRNSEANLSTSEYLMRKFQLAEEMVVGQTYTFTIWGAPASGKQYMIFDNLGTVRITNLSQIAVGVYSAVVSIPSGMAEAGRNRKIINVYCYPNNGQTSTLQRIKMEKGANYAPVWTESPYDMNYIKAALKESGSIEGGLVLASLMRLGYTTSNGEYVTMAGMNGIYNGNDKGGGLMLWGGGDMIDPDGTRSGTPATSGIRMDGTAFFCNNVIRIEKNRIMVGDVVQLASDGLTLIDGNNNALRIGDVSVPELMTAASSSGQLSQSSFSSGQIMVYKVGNYYFASNTSINKSALNGNTVLPAGAVVTLSGTIEVPQMAGVTLNDFGATVVGDFYLDNTMLQTSHLNLQAGSGKWSTPFSTTLRLPRSGKLYGVLRFDYPIDKEAEVVDGSPFEGATFYMTTYSWQYTTSNQNTLGKNGFLAAWGQSILYCDEKGVEMRFNNFRLRLDKDGIRKSSNNGSSWSPL